MNWWTSLSQTKINHQVTSSGGYRHRLVIFCARFWPSFFWHVWNMGASWTCLKWTLRWCNAWRLVSPVMEPLPRLEQQLLILQAIMERYLSFFHLQHAKWSKRLECRCAKGCKLRHDWPPIRLHNTSSQTAPLLQWCAQSRTLARSFCPRMGCHEWPMTASKTLYGNLYRYVPELSWLRNATGEVLWQILLIPLAICGFRTLYFSKLQPQEMRPFSKHQHLQIHHLLTWLFQRLITWGCIIDGQRQPPGRSCWSTPVGKDPKRRRPRAPERRTRKIDPMGATPSILYGWGESGWLLKGNKKNRKTCLNTIKSTVDLSWWMKLVSRDGWDGYISLLVLLALGIPGAPYNDIWTCAHNHTHPWGVVPQKNQCTTEPLIDK